MYPMLLDAGRWLPLGLLLCLSGLLGCLLLSFFPGLFLLAPATHRAGLSPMAAQKSHHNRSYRISSLPRALCFLSP
ncbi:MAG: hypothetical protein DMG45_16830 [Acidobacteria bacterium]|nr:MAG: hypothetical protein DMG45_16830 [Acidobacteriota bacterium]